MVTWDIIFFSSKTRKLTLVQYVYIISVSFYHMQRLMQLPPQPRYRASMSQRYRTFIAIPLSLYQWKLDIFLLYIFIILRILHKWNHSVCDLLGIVFFSFIQCNVLEIHSSCCIRSWVLFNCQVVFQLLDYIYWYIFSSQLIYLFRTSVGLKRCWRHLVKWKVWGQNLTVFLLKMTFVW